MSQDLPTCIRCREIPTSSSWSPFCVKCSHATRCEIERGVVEMREWLENDPHAQKLAAWAEYDREHQPSA